MDIVCFSHLRWNFVYQRPQHLMSRFAQLFRVFVIEEPVYDPAISVCFADFASGKEKVWIITPHLPSGIDKQETISSLHNLLQKLFKDFAIKEYLAWYYTPMGVDIGLLLDPPVLTIYDCMDELSAFKNAPPCLQKKEVLLFQHADMVFTGGYSLYEEKKHLHSAVYPFPSSIDKKHFSRARLPLPPPGDQSWIPRPRIGFFGVLDERLDIGLVHQVAQLKPDWQFILIGPVVKIDPASLPSAANIHFPGSKTYEELPVYLAGWDVAMIPFADNESTRFISPTKTPEYLAGGIPVVSTSIKDVVHPYGDKGFVYIADDPKGFINGIEWGFKRRGDAAWLDAVDDYLATISWDITWNKMLTLIMERLDESISGNLIRIENEYV